MNLKIKNIALYPINRKLNPKFISFDGDKINIITGLSKRGKSSIIDIIDYCLGSSDCSIPTGYIRNFVDVFALKISINENDYFIGRDCPKDSAQSSNNMYFIDISKKGEYPELNTNKWLGNKDEYKENRDSIKSILDAFAKFKNIQVLKDNKEKESGFTVGFRDTTAFQFQSQSIIANNTTIFYNTDEFQYVDRLKILFPLALGYKSYEMLLLDDEIKDLESEVYKLNSKIEIAKEKYEYNKTNLYEYYSEGIKLGLTNSDINLESSNVEAIKSELQNILKNVKKNTFFIEGNSIRFSEKLEEFEKQRLELNRTLQTKRMEFNKILKFETAQNDYLNIVHVEIKDKLKPIEWFLNRNGTDICPFCDSKSDKALIQLQRLKEVNTNNQKLLGIKNNHNLTFENEKKNLKKDIQKQEIEIKEFDKNIDILLNETKDNQFTYQKIYEYIGKIKLLLDSLVSPDNKLILELEAKQQILNSKRITLNNLNKKFDKDFVLSKVTKSIKTYIDLLPIENKEHCNVLLDPTKYIGIKIKDDFNKSITFLNKIGSGSNYMCYHLATMLGLHEYFYKLKEEGKINYVPSFIVFDQPSQVYYPDIDYTEKLQKKSKSEIRNKGIRRY
ncbi:Protein of unknown function [Chryseobacterium rhizoplanae]|uniref:AAA domain-containing protein n=1 Tax=Chryseobacterium rhizoplanae TaxID=1609531 RepID=A0A521DJ19_9FLAO|nr:DUF3732 domain-containing protein [Chryseobacterium rhizoplanae]SMO71754.1 Protein of unknown function [Chryseobacterium rhizoplanae]